MSRFVTTFLVIMALTAMSVSVWAKTIALT
jgi:hypothetical protein